MELLAIYTYTQHTYIHTYIHSCTTVKSYVWNFLLYIHTHNIHTYIHTPIQLSDIHGKPSKSDPYLKISLGKHKFNDRENAVDEVHDVVRTNTYIHTYIHTYKHTYIHTIFIGR